MPKRSKSTKKRPKRTIPSGSRKRTVGVKTGRSSGVTTDKVRALMRKHGIPVPRTSQGPAVLRYLSRALGRTKPARPAAPVTYHRFVPLPRVATPMAPVRLQNPPVRTARVQTVARPVVPPAPPSHVAPMVYPPVSMAAPYGPAFAPAQRVVYGPRRIPPAAGPVRR